MSDYAFLHEGCAFIPNRTAIDVKDIEAHNTALEKAELAQWAAAPDYFAGYILKTAAKGGEVTTWCGAEIGTIVAVSHYRTNVSRSMVAVTVRGTNGALYHGRYGSDWTQLVRLRKNRKA